MMKSIIQETIDQVFLKVSSLKEAGENDALIAKNSGLKQAWVQRFLNNGFKSPGADKIAKLESYVLHGVIYSEKDSTDDKAA